MFVHLRKASFTVLGRGECSALVFKTCKKGKIKELRQERALKKIQLLHILGSFSGMFSSAFLSPNPNLLICLLHRTCSDITFSRSD